MIKFISFMLSTVVIAIRIFLCQMYWLLSILKISSGPKVSIQIYKQFIDSKLYSMYYKNFNKVYKRFRLIRLRGHNTSTISLKSYKKSGVFDHSVFLDLIGTDVNDLIYRN